MTTQKASPEQLDKIGAIAAEMVNAGDRVGLGSGKAALAFVRALGERVCGGDLQIICVPTSSQTERVASDLGIPMTTIDRLEALDITVDGADEVDPYLNLIKGGGGYLTREKVIASISEKFVIVVGEEKIVPRLGTNFPVFIEVIEFARPVVTRKLQTMGALVTQRMNSDGTAFLTDNGNPYLNARFQTDTTRHAKEFHDPHAFDLALRRLPGVVETGLFINMATEVIVARFDGMVERKS